MSIRHIRRSQYFLTIAVTTLLCLSCSKQSSHSNDGVIRTHPAIPDGPRITIAGQTILTAEYRSPDRPTQISSRFGMYDERTHKSYQLVLPDSIELALGNKYKLTGTEGVAINPKQVAQGYEGIYLFFVNKVSPQ